MKVIHLTLGFVSVLCMQHPGFSDPFCFLYPLTHIKAQQIRGRTRSWSNHLKTALYFLMSIGAYFVKDLI